MASGRALRITWSTSPTCAAWRTSTTPRPPSSTPPCAPSRPPSAPWSSITAILPTARARGRAAFLRERVKAVVHIGSGRGRRGHDGLRRGRLRDGRPPHRRCSWPTNWPSTVTRCSSARPAPAALVSPTTRNAGTPSCTRYATCETHATMTRLFNRYLRGDRTIWMVALLLGVVSLLAVYSSTLLPRLQARGWEHASFPVQARPDAGHRWWHHVLRAPPALRRYSKLSQVLLGPRSGCCCSRCSSAPMSTARALVAIPVVGIPSRPATSPAW